MANLWQSSFPTYSYIGLYSFTMFSPTPSINCVVIMEGRFIMYKLGNRFSCVLLSPLGGAFLALANLGLKLGDLCMKPMKTE